MSEERLKSFNAKVRGFYERQNTVVTAHIANAEDAEGRSEALNAKAVRAARLATFVSLACNVCLLAIKVAVVVKSGSLSIIASALDSVLDLVSGSILFFAGRMVQRSSAYDYPAGAGRAQPVAMVVFSTIMTMVSLQVIFEAVQRFIAVSAAPGSDVLTLALVGVVVLVKFLLMVLCRRLPVSATTEALGDDHRNDVLTNAFGLVFYAVASKYPHLWWMDPLGASLFALYLIYNWVSTGVDHARSLIGHAADPAFLQQITNIALNHDERIVKIDTIRAFSFGENNLVEVDIVLPESMSVKESHDITEALQHKLERVTGVERAILHIDYEWSHKSQPIDPGAPHTWKNRS